MGVVSSMEAITAVALGLVAGAAADRLPHRRMLLVTDLLRAATLAVLASAVAGHGYPVWWLYVGAALLGALRVLHDASASAVLPILVEGPDLLRANGQMNASEAAANAVGPAVAGGLIAVGGPALALGSDAATFALSGGVVGRLRRLDRGGAALDGGPRPAGPQPAGPQPAGSRPAGWPSARWRPDIVVGVRALLADRWMLWALGMAMAMNVVAVSVEGQFIPYAKEVLGIGGFGIGAYWAVGGTAAVATSLLAGRYQTARGDAIVAGLTVFSAGVLLAGLWPSHATAALAYIGAGVGSALVITHVLSLRQRRFAVGLQGRVSMASRIAMFLLVPPAHIGGGAVAAWAGSEILFVGTAAVGLAAAGVGVGVGLLRLRQG